MNAQLKPIEARAIERPSYDNTFLGWESDWVSANRMALHARWNELEPLVEAVEANGFSLFCASQHDIELTRRDEFKNTLRQYE